MSTRNRLPRAVVTLALPLALWTALPAVQWCTLRWDQVRLECFARCERTTPAVAPCARASGGCPLAAASGSAPCGAAESCAAHGHAAGIHATAPAQAACPLSARWAPGLKRPASPAHGRAYCLGAPNGGLALRASAPSPDPAGTISALAATDIDREPVRHRRSRVAPETRARPPTWPWASLPLARAPPGVSRA